MEQFREIGKIVGGLRALMVLKHDIQINQRQCCLLLDMYELAFETIYEEIKQNLRFDERSTKWKSLELPMEELHKIIKEGEQYIKYCLDIKDWWGKVMSLHMNKDCIEFHIHNLLCVFPVVIEAIETAAEISGFEEEVMLKRRFAHMKKYNIQCNDPKLFQWMFGKQYLMPRDIEIRVEQAWKEDRWLLLDMVKGRKNTNCLAKHEQRLGELLVKKLNGLEPSSKLLPSYALVGASDYISKRRLGASASHIKEVHWLGENFALKTLFGDIEPVLPQINTVLTLSHPNVMQYICGFYDGERKEGFLVMDLMSKSLDTYMKENCGQRKRVPFSLPVVIDVMLQIARGMEYLHSKGVYHGELNPSHILLKQREKSPEGYYLVKVTGMVLNSIKKTSRHSSNNANDGIDQVIWYAPEVAEQNTAKYTDKADVYSFGMLCFLLLTGKTPFDDTHLQGEKVLRNITAGERPLFPFPSPRYLVNMTRKCWQTNPAARPTFSSICRTLRYIKKALIIHPDLGLPECPQPLVDYCDVEAGYYKKVVGDIVIQDFAPISQIPFQIFAYRLVEEEKIAADHKDKAWYTGNGMPSLSYNVDGNLLSTDDGLLFEQSDRRSVCSEIIGRGKTMYGADSRSVTSEMPQRRRFVESDQRSVGSESPGRIFFSLKKVDQRRQSIATTTSESKFSIPKAASSENLINNNQEDTTKAENNKTVIKVTPVAKSSTTSEEEHMKHMSIDEGKTASEIALTKSLAKRKAMRTLSGIPEDIIALAASPKTALKSGLSKETEKKAIPEGKQKSTKTPNTKQESPKVTPGSSPARIFRRKSMVPSTQVNKKVADSPKSSPRHPSSYPPRHPSSCTPTHPSSLTPTHPSSSTPTHPSAPTPRHPSSCTTSKGYLSPRQSPLHRCTRMNEDNPVSTGSSAPKCKLHSGPWIA